MEYDTDLQDYRKVPTTFDRILAYNSNQSTGLLNLILKNSDFEDDGADNEARVALTDSNYRVSHFRDIVIDNTLPIWTKAWTYTQSVPYSYIDKVPYFNNLNSDINQFELKRLRDHYAGVRMFFNPEQNYKILFDLVATSFANRNR